MRKAAREDEAEAEDIDKFTREQDELSEAGKRGRGRGRGKGKGKGKGRGKGRGGRGETAGRSRGRGAKIKDDEEKNPEEKLPEELPAEKEIEEPGGKSKKRPRTPVRSPSQARLQIIQRMKAARSERDLDTPGERAKRSLDSAFAEAGKGQLDKKPRTREPATKGKAVLRRLKKKGQIKTSRRLRKKGKMKTRSQKVRS